MFTSDSREELIAFADDVTLGAAAPDESSLILQLHAMTEKILVWFAINQLTLNVKMSYLLIFSRKGVSCPTITELHTPRGSISRPPDRYVRFLGALLDENLSFKWHVHPKIKAFISFLYPPSYILLSDLPLYMLLFVCVGVNISLGT